MAKIPIGNFGNMIAEPAPRVRIPQGAFDTGSGLKEFGDAGIQVASAMMNEEKQQANALRRAEAANAVLDREIGVKQIGQALSEEIASGKLHYDEADKEYQRRISALPAPNVKNIDPVTALDLETGFKRADLFGQTAVQSAVKTARIADFKTQTEGILDKLGKKAGLPGADVGKLNAQIDGMDEIGQRAYGASWAKRKQDWKDNNWYDHLNQQSMSVRDNLQGITDLQKRVTTGDYADKLDSNKRNTIVARLDGYKTSLMQRQEAAAARAERLLERKLKRAEAVFNTFQSQTDKGTILDPQYIDQSIKETEGTPYQTGVIQLAKQAQEVGGIASRSIAEQQSMLDAIDREIAARGRSPALDKRREQVSKVLSGSVADLKENGLRAGLERGVITDISPIDVSTPESFAVSVANRLDQSELVSTWAGKPVSPLDSNEADQMRQMLDSLPAKQKSFAVATISEAVGPRYAGAIANQLDKKDKALSLAFAAGGSVTKGESSFFGGKKPDFITSELILKGAAAIKDKTVMQDDKRVTGWRSTIASEVEGAFADQVTADKVKDAAWYIAAGIAADNGGSVGTSDLRKAVRMAVGGEIITRNGKKLPVPEGMNASSLDERLRAFSADDIAKQTKDGKVIAGGVAVPAEDFAKSLPGQELVYAGPGRYAVIVRGRPVMNSSGRPIIVGVQ